MPERRPMFGGSGFGGPSRRGEETDIDITPMIDMTFLLLIFFMVTSTMRGTPDLDVPVARYGVGVETRGAMIVTLRAAETKDGPPVIQLGDGQGPTGDVDDVRRMVEEGVQALRTEVIIKAEGDVSHGFVQEVVKAVKSVPGAEISIGVRDEPTRDGN